jgi:hypothetical protein
MFSGRKGRHSEGNVQDPVSGPSTSSLSVSAGAGSSAMYDMPGKYASAE